MFWRFWETEVKLEEAAAASEPIPDPVYSWSPKNCGAKTLLTVPITTQFDTTDSCALADGESPFIIMAYRSEELFYADLKGNRAIFVDEIESDLNLKAKVLEFLTAATSARGVSANTMYGLINGWVDSTQAVQNCGTIEDTGPIGKVLATKACFPVFEIKYV